MAQLHLVSPLTPYNLSVCNLVKGDKSVEVETRFHQLQAAFPGQNFIEDVHQVVTTDGSQTNTGRYLCRLCLEVFDKLYDGAAVHIAYAHCGIKPWICHLWYEILLWLMNIGC